VLCTFPQVHYLRVRCGAGGDDKQGQGPTRVYRGCNAHVKAQMKTRYFPREFAPLQSKTLHIATLRASSHALSCKNVTYDCNLQRACPSRTQRAPC
jgi:hypothetical protein